MTTRNRDAFLQETPIEWWFWVTLTVARRGAHHTFPRNLPDFRSKWRPNIASKTLSEYQPMRHFEWGGSLLKINPYWTSNSFGKHGSLLPKKKTYPQNSVKPHRIQLLYPKAARTSRRSCVCLKWFNCCKGIPEAPPCQRLAFFVPKENVDKVKTQTLRWCFPVKVMGYTWV